MEKSYRCSNSLGSLSCSTLSSKESMKRDLKDYSIIELALDRRDWKLAIHV
jgi:hypothetical protein